MKLSAVLIATLGISAAIHASTLKQQIVKDYKKIDFAMLKMDVPAIRSSIGATLSPDFQYVEAGKSEDADAMFASIQQGFEMTTKVLSVKSHLVSLKESGDSATAQVSHSMVNFIKMPDKKKHKMVFTGVSEDHYTKTANGWKMNKMEWTSEKTTLDGKPMKM